MINLKVTADGSFEMWSDTLNFAFFSDSKTNCSKAITSLYLNRTVVSVAHKYLYLRLKIGRLSINYG